ncbi:MAG: hypothetical protein KAR20_13785 [Candidatus Heimdallarchaeota archaeon]|nr:hypothetical protein [Candidatus Heimdallarchaeota archaeon]
MKTKYIGVFNWYGEIHKMWCWAHSPEQAKEILVIRLAKKVDTTPSRVRVHYMGDKANFEIKEV